MERLAPVASALLHVLILLLLLLKLPDTLEDGAGGMAVDIVFDVPGDGTKGDGQDAAAAAAAASTAPEEPPAPAQAMAEPEAEPAPPPPPPPDPIPSPEPVVEKPPPPKPPKPPKPKPAETKPAPQKPPAPTKPVESATAPSGNGQVAAPATTGEGRGTAAGAQDPHAAAGEIAGEGGPVGNGVPRVASGQDLGDSQVRERLIGNTLSGMMGNRDGAKGRYDVQWQAYIRPDGTLVAKVFYKGFNKKGEPIETPVTERGTWTLENGIMCIKFQKKIDNGAMDCFRVQDVANKMAFYYRDCPYHASDRCNSGRLGQFGDVLRGNAFGL